MKFLFSRIKKDMILNALIVAVAREMQPNLDDVFDKLERIWDEYDVYAKVQG